jgi:hypothetical protein
MTRRMSRLLVLSAVTAALLISAVVLVPDARAQRPQRFSEAELFFELNDTDGDLGIHASIDGEPWTDLEIEGPGDRILLSIFSRGQLRTQGLTEVTFESAEPSFDELSPAAFLRRFPEGRYEIEGRAQGGGTIESAAVLSHVLAAPPENILVSGAPAAKSCDAEPLPTVSAPIVIARTDPRKPLPVLPRSGRRQPGSRPAADGHGIRDSNGPDQSGPNVQVRDHRPHDHREQYRGRKLLPGAVSTSRNRMTLTLLCAPERNCC